jgi:hypothetical protein
MEILISFQDYTLRHSWIWSLRGREDWITHVFVLADLVRSCQDGSWRNGLGICREKRIARHHILPRCSLWPSVAVWCAQYHHQIPPLYHKRFTPDRCILFTTVSSHLSQGVHYTTVQQRVNQMDVFYSCVLVLILTPLVGLNYRRSWHNKQQILAHSRCPRCRWRTTPIIPQGGIISEIHMLWTPNRHKRFDRFDKEHVP